jgi:GDP-mannose 6-dehydrogenase
MRDKVNGALDIAIFGLGYVGTTMAACLARSGHRIYGIDINAEKVTAFGAGRSPIVEPGVDELLRAGAKQGLLHGEVSVEPILNTLDIALLCVGTPLGPDGRLDYVHLLEVTRTLGRAIRRRERSRPPLLIVVRSTIMPGTMDDLILPTLAHEAGSQPGERFEIAFNPEFMREASAVRDYFSPPRIVIGERAPGLTRRLLGLYDGIDAPIFEVSFRLAESIKLLDNCFHALKVAFANEMGRLAFGIGLDPDLLAELFLADRKLNVSPAYLRPGGPYGGSCLPKDLQAMLTLAREAGIELPVLAAVRDSNSRHLDFLFERIVATAPPPGPILLVGLSFKAGTDDLRKSPNLALAERLLQRGYDLDVVDPDLDADRLVGANFAIAVEHQKILQRRLTTDLEGAARRARLVVIGKTIPGFCFRLPENVPVIDIPRLRLP